MSERGSCKGRGLEKAKRKCLDSERWRLVCHGYWSSRREFPEGARFHRLYVDR